VLRHFLCRKVAPIAMPLHACCVKPRSPWRALKRGSGGPNLGCPALPSTLTPAVALTPIARLAHQDLNPARPPGTRENPIPLFDHSAPLAVFWTGGAKRAI
jgi:hypothetical protein